MRAQQFGGRLQALIAIEIARGVQASVQRKAGGGGRLGQRLGIIEVKAAAKAQPHRGQGKA